MRFSANMRFKGTEKGLVKDIVFHIKKGDDIPGLFVICKTRNKNLLELFEYCGYMTEYAKRLDCQIIGLALGKQNAFELVYEMIRDFYIKNGSLEGFKENL